jgi:catechol 2,3-dioxygenase-like lactoylglutathione lyase family enzyme
MSDGMILCIDHVQIAGPKGCEEAARQFYSVILGMREIEKPETLRGRGGCWFQCGEQQLHGGVSRGEEGAPGVCGRKSGGAAWKVGVAGREDYRGRCVAKRAALLCRGSLGQPARVFGSGEVERRRERHGLPGARYLT